MNTDTNVARWYVIYTKTNEEDRAEKNLAAWRLETFYPRIRKKLNKFTGKAIYFSRPFFARYIFARFDAETLLHKVLNSRGVQKVLSIDYAPVPVDEFRRKLMKMVCQSGRAVQPRRCGAGKRRLVEGHYWDL